MADYEKEIEQFWPTIMQAWGEHGDKKPIIECDVVGKKVSAVPAKDYIDGLSGRTSKATFQQYEKTVAESGMMLFIRDSKNQVLRSYVFFPEDGT